MKWTYFAGAAILAAFFLLRAGAPPVAVALGVLLAAFVTFGRAARSQL